ncbi:MAG: NADP-dependent oxidoreductase [Hyphomonadaceae bacterium]
MPPAPSREIRLVARPVGLPRPDDFELALHEAPAPAAGEVQVRNLWMSVDPYMRGRLAGAETLGAPPAGSALGRVTASADPAFREGDVVRSMLGWREAFTAPAAALTKLPQDGLALETHLSALGRTGMSAWVGLVRIAQIKSGDVVFVSGAAGAVGMIACQIAKALGCRVIATAGSPAKAQWLESLAADAVVNYKTAPDLHAALAKAAPDGIDVYFDNVGGAHLEAAIELARPFARFVICGMISQYNDETPPPGPRNLFALVTKRIRMEGFMLGDHLHEEEAFRQEMTAWLKAATVQSRETVVHGLENAVGAFLGLFSGENTGKMLVKL